LHLYLQHEDYRTALTIELFEYEIVHHPETHYGIKLWTTFIDDEDGNLLNLRHYDDAAIDALAHQLSDEIQWCRVRPLMIDETLATVELYRAVHLPNDASRELAEVLQESVNDMLCEWVTLYPLLSAVANSTLTDLSHLGTLMNHSGVQQ
jgi:hypothetical protein